MMISLLHLHIVTLFIIYINVFIFNKKMGDDLGSKYFFISYMYHNHKQISCFIISYPFLVILIYFLSENIVPVGSLFISTLHVYFLYEITSRKNIVRKEEYIYWYKRNVKHSFSMHAHDKIKKDFKFLSEKINRAFLFKFEIIFFISLVIESEVIYEVFTVLDNMKWYFYICLKSQFIFSQYNTLIKN